MDGWMDGWTVPMNFCSKIYSKYTFILYMHAMAVDCVIGLVKMQEKHTASNLMPTNNYDNTKKGSTNLFSGLFSKLR